MKTKYSLASLIIATLSIVGCSEPTYDMHSPDDSLVELSKSTDLKPSEIRQIIFKMYRDPIDAHGKNINQITEDVRTAMLKRLDKRLEHAQLQLTRFGDEEMWASSFYVEDLLGALPQDPIRLVKSKNGIGNSIHLEYQFSNCEEVGAIKVSETDSSKTYLLNNGGKSPFDGLTHGKLRGLRCDGEWLEIPRYASDYSRANKSKYTQEYNEVLSKINQLQQTTDLRDLTRQWIR